MAVNFIQVNGGVTWALQNEYTYTGTHTHMQAHTRTCEAVPSAYCSKPSTVKGGCGSKTSSSRVSIMRLKWYCLSFGAPNALPAYTNVQGWPESYSYR
jgi:hypothetical protein